MWAYIDETGDPGGSQKSSEVFGMAAIVVGEQGAAQCRELADELRQEFNVPSTMVLSWKKHVRKHEARKYVAKRLAELTDVTVLYTYCRKSEVDWGQFTQDRALCYNYVAGKIQKAILWTASYDGRCAPRGLTVRFGHVRGLDHKNTTLPYFERRVHADRKVPEKVLDRVSWVDSAKYAESQIADLFAGCLHAALVPDAYGAHEGHYLRTVWPLIRNSHSCSIPLGLLSIPQNHLVTAHDWFPCTTCKHVAA